MSSIRKITNLEAVREGNNIEQMGIFGSLFGGSSTEDYKEEIRTYSYKYDDSSGSGQVSGHKETDHGDSTHCTNYYQSGESRGIHESWDRDNEGNGTLKRSKKKSFEWYKKVIASNGEDLE